MTGLRGRGTQAGTVTDFDDAAGLGTVTTVDGATYPFHCVEITDGTRTIDIGAVVSFAYRHKLGRVEAGALEKQ